MNSSKQARTRGEPWCTLLAVRARVENDRPEVLNHPQSAVLSSLSGWQKTGVGKGCGAVAWRHTVCTLK